MSKDSVESNGGLMTPVANPLFNGEVKTIEVTKDVNVHQLLHEVEERLGDRDKFQVVLNLEDDRAPVSESNKLQIHVHPTDVDMRTVRGVVESHVPDPAWGRTAEEIEIENLKARLLEGDLALPELNKIMRSILGG